MATSAKIDHVNKVPKNEKSKSFYFFVIFVAASFILAFIIGGFILGKEKVKKQQAVTEISEQVKIDSATLPDNPNSWKTYELKTIGLEIKLPEKLSEKGEWKEQIVTAKKGSLICFSNEASEDEICKGDVLFAGSTSTDFETTREEVFTDLQGFTSENGEHFANSISGNKFAFKNTTFKVFKNGNGVEIIKILGENYSGENDEIAIPGTPGKGYLGAIISTNNLQYPGISIQLKINDEISEYEFDQILESIKFLNQ